MKLGRNICHLSTVMYCKAERADLSIDCLLVSHENWTLCTLIGNSFRKAGQLFFRMFSFIFDHIKIMFFLKFTDHDESDAYAVIVHIGFFLNNELKTAISRFFFFLKYIFFFPNIYKTGHLLIVFRQICW